MEEEYVTSSDAENADFTTEDTDIDEDVISNADKSTTAMDGKDWVNKKKTKKKRKMRRKGGGGGGGGGGGKKKADEDERNKCDPIAYNPCPHLHFKANVVEREVLTREQHLMLLSTPRGYRWEPERSPRYCTNKSRRRKRVGGGSGDANVKNARKTDRRCMKPAEKHIGADDQRYVGRFLGEVWNYLPPDMVDNLKQLLVEEFGMTEKEAEDFIHNQGEQAQEKDVQQKPESVPSFRTGARYKWVKDFSKIFANKMSDYIIMLLSAKRTPRVRKLAEVILKHFADITGEKVTLRKADTRLQKLMVFIADRIAIWLDSIMKEAQTKDTADKAVEVKLQPEAGEDGDKKQTKKKKKEGEGDDKEEGEEEETAEGEEEKPKKEKKSAESSQKSSKTASKESSKETSKTPSKASSKASSKAPSKESSKQKVEEKVEEEEEKAGAEEAAAEEETGKEEEEAGGGGDAAEEGEGGEEEGEPEEVGEEEEGGILEKEEAGPEEPPHEPDDIKEVIEDQLTDPETAQKLSDMIKNILSETEDLVKPPLPPLITPTALRKKSFVYQIKREDGSIYNVRQLSSQTVAEKVAEARSREKPPRKAPGLFDKPNSLSPMNLKNMADWSRWAVEVADVAEKWTTWINQTVATAELAANAQKEAEEGVRGGGGGQKEGGGGGKEEKEKEKPPRQFTNENWKQWQARIQEQADDFRKIKKELKRSGSEWSKKAELSRAKMVEGGGGGVVGQDEEERETGVITYDEGKEEDVKEEVRGVKDSGKEEEGAVKKEEVVEGGEDDGGKEEEN